MKLSSVQLTETAKHPKTNQMVKGFYTPDVDSIELVGGFLLVTVGADSIIIGPTLVRFGVPVQAAKVEQKR